MRSMRIDSKSLTIINESCPINLLRSRFQAHYFARVPNSLRLFITPTKSASDANVRFTSGLLPALE